jgi:PEP-CTERM motif
MLRVLRTLTLFLLVFITGHFVTAETLTFDDLYSLPRQADPVFFYGNFTFYYFSCCLNASDNAPNQIPDDPTQSIFSNYYPFQPPSYPYIRLLDQNGNSFPSYEVSSFYSTSLQPFTLNNMLVDALDPVTILGYRNGVLVDQSSTSATNDLGLLTLNWTNIDAVFFENAPSSLGNYDVDLDTININEPITSTNIAPEPSTIALFGSSLLGLLTFARRRTQS